MKTKAIISGESDSEESSTKDSNNDAWKSSYIEFIEADPDISTTSDLCTCGLIYVDNDDIPELIVEYGGWALGTKIVSYKDGQLLSRSFAGEGGISYIEHKGLVHNAAGHMGTMTDEFAGLDKDGFHDLGFGTRYGDAEDYVHYSEYQWNWDDVTKEEYDNYVESVFDESQAKRWNAFDDTSPDNVYTAESMLNYLRGSSSAQQEMQSDSIQEPVIDKYTMEEYGIPYGHYYGGKPQGEGVLGLDMDLYENMTFSIVSAFDLFTNEDGDEYNYAGTYKIDRVDDVGNPVLHLHCDEGDYEFVWDGEAFLNDSIFAWYDGE